MTRVTLATFFLLLSVSLTAQTHETYTDWDTFLFEFLDNSSDTEDESIPTVETLCQRLEQLAAAPLNLNTATREDLLELPFLDSSQADSLLAYRERRGCFLTLGELMFVSGLDSRTRRWLSLFVQAIPASEKQPSLCERLFRGQHRLETRLDVPLYTRAGDPRGPSDYPALHPQNAFLGNRLGHIVRYRYDTPSGQVRYGLTLEKDSGEPFGTDGTRPYDYVSAYFFLRTPSRRWQLLAGDFEVHFGQGLLLGNGFLFNKRMAAARGDNNGTAFRPHTSTDENNFFRGTAAEMRFGRLRLQLFGSLGRRDATAIGGDSVTTWLSSGLHRSRTERLRRHNVGILAGGARLSWHTHRLNLALGGYGAHFDKTFAPPERPYNKYYLRGRSAGGFQTDYHVRLKRFTVEGEAALDSRLHLATTHTLHFMPRSGLTLLATGRSFSPRFVSVFGRSLAENSRLQNEYGLSAGISCTRSRQLAFEAFADFFRFPRPVWRASSSSQGFEAWAELRGTPRQKISLSLRYKIKVRKYDIPDHEKMMAYGQTQRTRLRIMLAFRRLDVSVAADGVCHTEQISSPQWGWMLSARCGTAHTRRFRYTLFSAFFSGGRSATALYAFEPALHYQHSLSSYRGRGFCLASTAQARIAGRLTAGLRAACLRYLDRDTQGSGAMLIDSPLSTDLSLQLMWTL